MSYTPMFTVLMSVYAGEKPSYLRASLASLATQQYPPGQIVLVCDGPLSQELDDVISEFQAALALDVVRLPLNVGLAEALNAGLQYSRHEWVARFDTDDICRPERLNVQREFILAHPDVDVFGSSIAEFTDDPQAPYAVREVKCSHFEILRQARSRNPLNHMTVVFRKSVVEDVGGYPNDYMYEDYALWVRLLTRGIRFGNISEPLVLARAGASMASRRGGWRYLKAELKAQHRFLQTGFIGPTQFVKNVAVRSALRLAPNSVRVWAYRSVLRRVARQSN